MNKLRSTEITALSKFIQPNYFQNLKVSEASALAWPEQRIRFYLVLEAQEHWYVLLPWGKDVYTGYICMSL